MAVTNFRLLVDIEYRQGLHGIPRRYPRGTVVGAAFLEQKHEGFAVTRDMFEATTDEIGPPPRDAQAEMDAVQRARAGARPDDHEPLTKATFKAAFRELMAEMKAEHEAERETQPEPVAGQDDLLGADKGPAKRKAATEA